MCACTCKLQVFTIIAIDKQPVRRYMTFSEFSIIALKLMVFILRVKRFRYAESIDNVLKNIKIPTPFLASFEIPFDF